MSPVLAIMMLVGSFFSSATEDLVEEGRRRYETGCAGCHGSNGEGIEDVAPSLVGVGAAAADFQLSTGRMPLAAPDLQPTRTEPVLSKDEIQALVAYVASLGEGPPIPEVDPRRGDLARGGELFRLNCAACHNVSGTGGALSYGRRAPSLYEATPTQIVEAMRTGPGPMPVFGPETLDREEADAIVRYILYLRDSPDPGGAGLGRAGPIPEGLVAWLFGMGALIVVVRWIEKRA